MDRVGRQMNGLSLHNYTIKDGKWPPKGSAIEFDEAGWIDILSRSLWMDELIKKHSDVMDKHDPEKKVGMVVDEWGTWHEVEPGTNPGFLFQQNSLRDAMVAALHFHVFQRHADRVSMANIAQMINVLQAMVLTDGPRMLRTPTYWVFEMFNVHQGGQVIPLTLKTPDYRVGSVSVPAVSASATRSDATYLSLANLNPHEQVTVCAEVHPTELKPAGARILTADNMQAHNTFDSPDRVIAKELTAVRQTSQGLFVDMPPMSIAVAKLV